MIKKDPNRDKAIGERLRQYRKRFYENQMELANKLEVSRSVLNLYELGMRPLPIEVAVRLAEMEGMTLDAIYLGRRIVKRDKLILDDHQ